jgi:hypothetical protein
LEIIIMTLSWPLAATVAATTFLALGTSLPASADTLTVTNIVVGKGIVSFTIPRIEVVDGNMTETDVRSAFSGEDIAAAARSLSSWDAASLRIPEMRQKQTIKSPEGTEQTVESVYRELTLSGLQDGVAQSSRIESIEMETTGPEGVTVSFGPATTGTFDIAGVVGFYAGGGTGEIKTLYRDFVLEGGELAGAQGFGCDIGKMAFAEFKARPLQTSPLEAIALAESLEGGKQPSPADMQKIIGLYVDIFQGMEVSAGTSDGMSCRFADEQGNKGNLSIGKIEIEGFGKGRYGAIAMNDFDVTMGDVGFMKAGKLVFKGMDLNPVLEALKNAGGELSEAWFEQNFRKLIPSFDGFAMEAMSFDLPDESNPGQRIKSSLEAFDVTLEAYRLGIPTKISITADGSVLDLPADGTDEELRQLREMGYDRIEMNSAFKLHWDEASSTIVVDEFSLGGIDMGSFNLTGTIGNAGEALFAEDMQMMQMAAMGLAIKELSVSTEDDGFAERIFTLVGKEQGQDAAAVRTQISGVAAGMIPMMLGGTAQAQKVANAVMTFLNGGSSLKITAVAKDAAGLGLMDFMAAQANPAALVEKVDISAEAR